MNGGYEESEGLDGDDEAGSIEKAVERALAAPIVLSSEHRLRLAAIWSTPFSPPSTSIEDVRFTSLGRDVSEDTEK